MQLENTEGITLQVLDFKEKDRILTIFTEDYGVISLIIKGISSKKSSLLSLTSPFCLSAWIYKKASHDLYLFRDATILDEHLFLRKDLSYLKAAGSMVKAILQSQLLHKQAKSLYLLLKSYLQQIPKFSDPQILISSFYLKLLNHEGILNLDNFSNYFSSSEEEKKIIHILAYAKSFSILNSITVPQETKTKIFSFFNNEVSQI